MSSHAPRVLISGSGIAGSAMAYWLLRAFPKAQITMVERCPTFRLTGSSVDLRSSAIDIVKRMGMEPEIRRHTTTEKGVSFIDGVGKTIATIRASGRSDGVQSITSEYEIFRSDLARILLEPSRDKIDLIFDDYVDRYEASAEDGVTVTFAKSKKTSVFDLLIAADGFNSRIRGALLNASPRDQIHDEGVHVAYFTAKSNLLLDEAEDKNNADPDHSQLATTHSAPGGKVIMIRPDPHPEGRSKILLMNVTPTSSSTNKTKQVPSDMKKRLNDALDQGTEAYMSLLEDSFADAGHKASRVLASMRQSDDFYCSLFAQVRSQKLVDDSSGRVVLLGDAGYATPGIGTSLAIIGAYVLAGELLATTTTIGQDQTNNIPSIADLDIARATKRYEDLMLPFVKSHQGDDRAMQFLNPQSEWGIGIRNMLLRVVTGLRIDRLAMLVAGKLGVGDRKLDMPDYAWPADAGLAGTASQSRGRSLGAAS